MTDLDQEYLSQNQSQRYQYFIREEPAGRRSPSLLQLSRPNACFFPVLCFPTEILLWVTVASVLVAQPVDHRFILLTLDPGSLQ